MESTTPARHPAALTDAELEIYARGIWTGYRVALRSLMDSEETGPDEMRWEPGDGDGREPGDRHLVKLVFARAAAGAAAVGRRSTFSALGPRRLAAATLRRSKTSITSVCPSSPLLPQGSE